jgi:hypothetical protein
MLCSLLSQLCLLAHWPDNSPQSGSTAKGKRREKPLCWKPGLRSDARGASEAVRSLRTSGAGSYHRGSRYWDPRGFAFVEMTDDADAEKAIKGLNGSILRDRTLNVNYARPRPERPAA